MILHTLNKSPSNEALSKQLSQVIQAEDQVILLEDGVYHSLLENNDTNHWLGIAAHVHALNDDLKARGLTPNNSAITTIDYADFVRLSSECDKVIAWY